MRRWIIVLAVVLAVAGAIALAVNNLGTYLNENRDAVAKQVESRLGRRVAFGEVGVSLAGGLGVRVADLRIGDDPAFSQEDFLSAEAVDVRVKILPILFGKVEVARVILRSPRITLIQTNRGLSTDSLGGGGKAEAGGAPPAFLVSLLDMREGDLRLVDRTAKPPVELHVAQIDVRATDLSLSDPVEVDLSASLFGGATQNLRVTGTLGPLAAQAPRVDLELRVDPLVVDEALRVKPVRALLPAELSASGPVRVDAEAEGTLQKLSFRAHIDATRAALRYGEDFDKAPGVALDARLRGTKTGNDVAIDSADLVLDETTLHATATVANLDAPRIQFTADSKVFDGALSATGSYDLRTASRPSFAVNAKLADINVEKLRAAIPAVARFRTGTLGANLDLRGAGAGWEAIQRVLSGNGSLRIAEGVLTEFNPAGGTLRALMLLPTFTGSGLQRFFDAHPRVFGASDTPFDQLDGKLEIREGWIHVGEFVLDTSDYALSGRGRYSLAGELDLKTALTFSKPLSEELLAAEPRLRYARGADGRVQLPVALRGTPPKVAVVPDVSALAGTAAREALTDALTKALGGKRAAGGTTAPEGQPTTTPPEGEPTAAPQEGEPTAAPPAPEPIEQQLLRRGLEGLLGGGKKEP